LNIHISNSSGLPIYEQISTQIKNIIISRELVEGDSLPSIRLLAKELRISVITTKRAYDDLERDGYIVSVPGKGSFVAAPNLERIKEEHLRRIEDHLTSAIQLASISQVPLKDLIELIQLLYKGEQQ